MMSPYTQALTNLAKERQEAGLLAALGPKDVEQLAVESRDHPGCRTELSNGSFPLYESRQIVTECGISTIETSV